MNWPDGKPIHPFNVFVKLACGHWRVSSGWRGSAGETYCCDACGSLTYIIATLITDEKPHEWREPSHVS